MSEEDLQTFRSHPGMWDDEPTQSPSSSSSDDRIVDHHHNSNNHPSSTDDDDNKKQVHQLNISWPLTSFSNTIQNVCCISFLIGFLFNLNLIILIFNLNLNSSWNKLNFYFLFILSFHFLEFIVTAIFNPSRVTVDSFLINNGNTYWYAQGFCTLEYIMRERYWGTTRILAKQEKMIEIIGLSMIITGQIIRSLSMITASKSFNHRVSNHLKKKNDHILITHGIYSWLRHPSYFGFFWWSIGIQFFLLNPLSLLTFSFVLWKFFNSRIQYEEYHLVKFFNQAYIDYRSSTPTYIPFIK